MAKHPRIGTIGKNHIQSSFLFLKVLLFFAALNMILSLGIIPYPLLRKIMFSAGGFAKNAILYL